MNINQLIILLLLIFISCKTISCKTNKIVYPIESVDLYPIGKNGLWGYAKEGGEVMIPYKFEKVTFFMGDRAAVKQNGKFGFINKHGEYIMRQKFDSIGYFDFEKANLVKNGKKLTIGRSGKKLKEGIVIGRCGTGIEYTSKPDDYFDKIGDTYVLKTKDFANQQRLDPKANFKISDFTFDEVIPFSSKSIIVKKNNKYDIYVHFHSVGLKGIWADEIIPFYGSKDLDKEIIQAHNATYRIGEKWGLISRLGHVELEPEFYSIEEAQGMFYIVEYKPKHWGCMTHNKIYFNNDEK